MPKQNEQDAKYGRVPERKTKRSAVANRVANIILKHLSDPHASKFGDIMARLRMSFNATELECLALELGEAIMREERPGGDIKVSVPRQKLAKTVNVPKPVPYWKRAKK